MNVGFIGLGLMGRPMALNLMRAGHSLRVWARRAESMQPLLDAGALACSSAADVARGADVVITIVGDAPDVERVALGPEGIADGAREGLIHIDMSTISPEVTEGIAARLRERGVTMLDAPVSGGEPGAINATLTIMVGGDASAFECAKPLFEAMGKAISHIGGNGAGQVAKACNQIVTGVGVASVAEALNFARASGVDAGAVREVLMGGFAASRILDAHGGRMVKREFRPGFKSWMHQKDMRIVLDEAHRMGLQLPTAAAAAQLFNAMVGSGLGEEDSVAMLKLFERMSGGEG
ncbi:2-hydroxy-3-oxopropionate reductase [Pseudazoarcus pumilus]|uniref:2-hydroxy-3-oxopropionate reductase n=1 Tax=Pseudazoarcus pumilus TaxID=2067960 RepID=A0A2I6S459_9RHOO|nr:2-hydroxy-3-oxopropionate reductase [Pseudazoarcus pumilus]AUN94043.1 2-hydroxy-3-oxopropionate reductase [Pseudazoarcus pumilus]